MSFVYQGAFIGPFSISVGRGTEGQIQKFRYPVPVKHIERYIPQALFVLSGQVKLSWSTGSEYDTVLGVGGSFTDDAPSRPIAVDEELQVKALTDASYVCVGPVGFEQKVRMERHLLQSGHTLEVPRYDLAVVGDDSGEIEIDGNKVVPGPRFFYGRTRAYHLQGTNRPSQCAVFTMLG